MGTVLKRSAAGAAFCALLGLLGVWALGCGEDEGEPASGIRVTASTTHLADLAANVAGERAAVSPILGPTADPHDYEPKPSDAQALLEADLILRSGGDLDLWLDDLVDGSGASAPVVDVLAALPVDDPVEGGEVDPHWWQDPAAAADAVEVIRDRLIEVDPDGAGEYEANAAAYLADLRRLDRAIAGCMRSVPEAQRKLITSHDSLGRFADRYGIEVVGAAVPALSTQAQPSAGETAALVELIREQDVRAIFPEAGVAAELEQAIAADAGAELGGELWADALGPEGSGGETYLLAMAANAATLAEGFSGGTVSCDPAPMSQG
jgi:zinc/manganese transport system substrate-binding protein